MKKIIILLFVSTFVFANIGKIITLRGDATIKNEKSERKAKINDILDQNDEVITSNNSKLQIKFIDNTIITLGKNTNLNIKDYIIDGKNSKVKLGVDNGSFKVISGKISQLARKNFEFQAKTATIGIRGTVFVGKLGNVDKVGCLEGAIDVKIGDKVSLINAGKQLRFDNNKIIKIEKIIPKDYEESSISQKETKKDFNINHKNNEKFNNYLEAKEQMIKAKKSQYSNKNLDNLLENKQKMIEAKKDYYKNKYNYERKYGQDKLNELDSSNYTSDGKKWLSSYTCSSFKCGVYLKGDDKYKVYYDYKNKKLIEKEID